MLSLEELKKCSAILHSPVVCQKDIIDLMTMVGTSRNEALATFTAMKEYQEKKYKEEGKIDPKTKTVKKKFMRLYLEDYDIRVEDFDEAIREQEERI